MKSKCLIKIQWVLEIVSKTKMSSRLTNSAHITETTGCHSGIQLPLTSPRFFRRVSGQVVSTMCSRMSLHPGFSSDAPGQASATAVLWGHCFSELPALNPGLSPGLWVNPGNDQTSQSLTGKRLLVLTISTSGLKINPLGQVSMDGGVELVGSHKPDALPFFSTFIVFSLSLIPVFWVSPFCSRTWSPPQSKPPSESNHARSYLESRISPLTQISAQPTQSHQGQRFVTCTSLEITYLG